jgi:hypothetical protein
VLLAAIRDRSRPLKHTQCASVVLHSGDRLPAQEVASRTGVGRGPEALSSKPQASTSVPCTEKCSLEIGGSRVARGGRKCVESAASPRRY